MELVVPTELEELILCSCCHLPFNDTDAQPKLFSCRHHFCLKCVQSILLKSGEMYCVHCWKRTELPAPDHKPENLPTHTAILYLAQNLSMLNMKPKAPDKQSGQQQQMPQSPANKLSSGGCNASNSVVSAAHQSPSMNSAIHASSSIGKMKKGENCLTHAMPNALWCLKCHAMICRACANTDEHRNHTVKTQTEAKDTIRNDIANELLSMQKSLVDVQHLVLKQRDFLLKILEACTALKTQIETELINHMPTLEIAEMRESLGKAKICLGMLEHQLPSDAYRLYSTLHLEKQRLQAKHQEMYLQCKLDDLIRQYGGLFDFDLIKQALVSLQTGESFNGAYMTTATGHHNPVLLLANYCISQLYSRHVLSSKHVANQQMVTVGGGGSSSSGTIGGTNTNNANGVHYASTAQTNTTQNLLTVAGHHERKTFAEIAGSPKGPSVNNNNNTTTINNNHLTTSTVNNYNHMADILTNNNGTHLGPPGLRHTTGTTGQTYMQTASEMNGIAVPISMMQHLQHSTQQQMSVTTTMVQSPQQSNIICNPTVHVYPIYYFNIEINGTPCGRILIEVRNDVAPKMAKNFGALSTGELGFGYKGCQIFQCWESESIITGDFELNNGRGGRSVFEEGYFMPDDTKILAIRGSVGMRRSQKRHDNMGLVGSQFRIILREMRGFTGIFAFVVEGLELVEKISQAGDSAGKPQSNVMIVNCGKLQ